MTYVILVRRSEDKAPSVYVEQGSTPWVVPNGARRGNKLYTLGRAFERVYGGNHMTRTMIADNSEFLWGSDHTLVQAARTRDDGSAVQVHAVL